MASVLASWSEYHFAGVSLRRVLFLFEFDGNRGGGGGLAWAIASQYFARACGGVSLAACLRSALLLTLCLQALPVVAVAPLLMMWLGSGIGRKSSRAMVAIFPVLSMISAGL